MRWANVWRLMLLALLVGGALSTAHAAYPANSGDLVYASAFEAPALQTGGSNYLWYRISDCDREPYGLVANYHLTVPGSTIGVRGLAQQQLAGMYAAGQRRLSLGIYFAHGQSSGTIIDSANATVVAQAATNVGDLLADAKAAGFAEVLFRFFPQGAINPSDSNFDAALIDEYWNLIVAMRPALVASGMPYRLDLMVEGAPRDANPPIVPNPWKYPANRDWSDAVRTLWQRYYPAYGKADTVGFSFLTDADPDKLRYRVRHMRFVYEGNYPDVFAADFYGTPQVSEADKFIALHDAMVREDANGSLGWRDAHWIIAEGYYDDPLAATDFVSAMASTHRVVQFLTQWPWDRANLDCGATPQANVAPPIDWAIYGGYGF